MNTLPLPEVEEISLGINQWENQLYAQVINPATFEKLWNSVPEPKRECVVYDWPDEKIKQS